MKRYIILINLLSICFFSKAQEKVFELKDSFVKFQSNKESYALPNQLTGDLMLLLEEGRQFRAHLLDNGYTNTSKISTKTIPSKYRYILGYNIEGNTYSIFFSDSWSTKFGVQTFDFDTKTAKNTFLDFKIKGEKYVESVVYNNKIHVITITKKSSDLNIYTFDKQFIPTKNTVSLKELEYPNPRSRNHTINAYYLLLSDTGGISRSVIDIEKIEGSNPNVIETTSKENKLYQFNNQLVFSFDYNHKKTQLCFIDLETFETVVKSYDKPSNTEEGYRKSNSYIFDNKLFQIASSNQKMKFTVLDLKTEKMIKEYKVTKEDTIRFKNSPIIQEGGGILPGFSENRVREMEKTSKYLRKISSSDLGISVYKVDNAYNIVLGGTKEITTSNGYTGINGFGGGFGMGGTVGGSTVAWIGFNPTFYNYSSYTTTKSTYINCLFDNNFDHIQGDIKKNGYDRLFEFEDNLDIKTKAVNIFLHKDRLHYGFFDPNKRTYELYSFKE
ncbi:hypothetical protein D1818_12885 [Aquimarina sp. BL5]|uniref:hypothetical protein n=1 Tax=Aquimarina sp. BL5 TaxID=1714860 RepID=UPI000E52827B|nr:hypothetical protein [Aquimarina sp. BL5]AXT51690.1 hypothetical protein D1818_12885 [Aquimarina sp. BL5]RKN02318.1 hypothetical protein D7036_16650 [Aquimarina sp. BL5]